MVRGEVAVLAVQREPVSKWHWSAVYNCSNRYNLADRPFQCALGLNELSEHHPR